MPAEMLKAKFYACAQHASLDLSREVLERVVELVDRIEEVDDIGIVPRLLGGDA
jgi:hypothetical protein